MTISFCSTSFNLAMTVYTLGLYRIYYLKKRFPTPAAGFNPESEQDMYLQMLASYQLWGDMLLGMKPTWKAARDSCILLVPLSIAILQIGVVSDTLLARTSAISAFLFATMGLIMSYIYIFGNLDLNNRRVIDKWVKVSVSIDTLESVEFWVCLALPVSCVIWSGIFCITALTVAAYSGTTGPGDPTGDLERSSITASLIYLAFLILVKAVIILRAMQILRGQVN